MEPFNRKRVLSAEPNQLLRLQQKVKSMGLLLLIVVLVLLFGGGGGYYAHNRYGGRGLGGVLGLVIVVLVIVWLVGGLHGFGPGPV